MVLKPDLFTVDWANDQLRYFLREILYNEACWYRHPYNKVIIGWNIADDLRAHGFWWQADRIENHVFRWLKGLSCTSKRRDLSRTERERGFK